MVSRSEGNRTSVFLAGATGVLGRRVLPQLMKAGHNVTAIGRSDSSRSWLAQNGAKPVELDLFDASAVRGAVDGHEVVINLATSVPINLQAFVPGAWRMTNRIRRYGAANLAEAAQAGGAKRFIQESFAPIYLIVAMIGSTKMPRSRRRDTTAPFSMPKPPRVALPPRGGLGSHFALLTSMVLTVP